jgi:hypothetical protein
MVVVRSFCFGPIILSLFGIKRQKQRELVEALALPRKRVLMKVHK